MLPWQWHLHQLNHQKTKVCVINLLPAIFDNWGNKVNETQVSKTVFSHFKDGAYFCDIDAINYPTEYTTKMKTKFSYCDQIKLNEPVLNQEC